MIDKPKPNADLPKTVRNITEAPLIWFDGVSNQGGIGIINVTLAVLIFAPNEDGGVDTIPTAVANLRCTRDAAINLRDSLNTAIANGEVPEGPVN